MSVDLYNYCVWLLAAQEQSSKKLKLKLLRKGHSEQEINDVFEKLIERNYLSDERYLKGRAKSLLNHRKKGPHYIQAKLNQEGLKINIDEIHALMEESNLESKDLIQQALHKILQRRRWNFAELDFHQKSKLAQALHRQGFSLKDIFALIKEDSLNDLS